MLYHIKVLVYLKDGVLDTQGKAVLGTLHRMNYTELKDIRIGKYLQLWIEAPDKETAKKRVVEMCSDLLVNDLIEDYSIEVDDIS
ncbi:phosphoribosylformylglycinamidine synthase, purS [Thermovirga lienii DSM 17291]|jgi:phosphoribosylformylglycinamidine synthase PurS subunit|uniref:Phosphoribosylformylglycinamidine synthase subunit PurS n=1 Tax=Thermovirga lienii (strain ATCC BAA-1197 / DSM 17291 / Cas60314) TaxID=580340 RepID=G7V594_THELD|nr:phosphoribosylformylglycinamidine synthase subunit PurS [Thermovirga lienii]MDN5318104.1 phosphoribosylformylglycinamidine synthase subunit PurS [Thermovirga sp.]AER66877.1 phosphoribosylformylglycinamidine synthase, purS [Thermovirga lienii DSM 17291]KUK42748.1 MAG: Phosphoribosylformylglycinamidine synthase, purS [Thermovirga lienii]MDN5367315.1 phosphoribosylformylglycinamidine synthase subunit PurS [Thermovirga sp.]HCD71950.1 phosphoribosylformylglycinamidine synthase subunit PurS [Ther